MAGRIAVRAADLERFATQIDRVRDELSGSMSDIDGAAAGIRSGIVVDALRDFADAWSDRRRSLFDEMADASDVLRRASIEFTAADEQVAGGLSRESH